MYNLPNLLEERYANKKVLVIGMGGGGDIMGTLPTAMELEAAGAEPIIGGLTWKRRKHDARAGPRRKEEFENVGEGTEKVWYVNADTRIRRKEGGGRHIESALAEHSHWPVVSVDINGGVAATYHGIREFCQQGDIAGAIGVDVGGDVFCYGNEPTIRSPTCDSIMLGVLAKLDNSLLGLCALGTDGELTVEYFQRRFKTVMERQGYLGSHTIDDSLLEIMMSMFRDPELLTEVSRRFVDHTSEYGYDQRTLIAKGMNSDDPSRFVELARQHQTPVTISNGERLGGLQSLTTLTMYFDPRVVYDTNEFSTYIEDFDCVETLQAEMQRRGLITESMTK